MLRPEAVVKFGPLDHIDRTEVLAGRIAIHHQAIGSLEVRKEIRRVADICPARGRIVVHLDVEVRKAGHVKIVTACGGARDGDRIAPVPQDRDRRGILIQYKLPHVLRRDFERRMRRARPKSSWSLVLQSTTPSPPMRDATRISLSLPKPPNRRKSYRG